MRNITSIILITILTLGLFSCGQREVVNTSEAPQEVVDAVLNAYELSQELTDLQLKAGEDMQLDDQEIEEIGEAFRYLAIVNNINAKTYASDKYFIALRKEYKDAYEVLADTVVFLKDCKGYDQLGLTIKSISLEVRDVTELPVIETVEVEMTDTIPAEPMDK